VTKPLLETSRKGYLAAISASTYSYVSLLKYFAPILNHGGASLSLTYLASERIIPGYGGGMSSAKAALESDTRVSVISAKQLHKYNLMGVFHTDQTAYSKLVIMKSWSYFILTTLN
jgi:enoyl-[acyl-carrier protein] reductase I